MWNDTYNMAKILLNLIEKGILTKEQALEQFGGTYEDLEKAALSVTLVWNNILLASFPSKNNASMLINIWHFGFANMQNLHLYIRTEYVTFDSSSIYISLSAIQAILYSNY